MTMLQSQKWKNKQIEIDEFYKEKEAIENAEAKNNDNDDDKWWWFKNASTQIKTVGYVES